MTKYYCVRTPEQWDWLMAKFEEQNKGIAWPCGQLPPDYNRYYLYQSQTIVYKNDKEILNLTFVTNDPQYENKHSFIEVSDLMEDEKMEKYVTIKDGDLLEVKDENNRMAFFPGHSDYWHGDFKELLIPKSLLYTKVKMTTEEKTEFDKLEYESTTLITAITKLHSFGNEYPLLCERLAEDNQAQNEFARAWADPDIIEVVKEKKYRVKVPPFTRTKCYFIKDCDCLNTTMSSNVKEEPLSQFTKSELKQYGLDSDLYEKVEVQD